MIARGLDSESMGKVDLSKARELIKGLVTRHAPAGESCPPHRPHFSWLAAGGGDAVELLRMLQQASKEMMLRASAIENVNSWMLKMKSLSDQARTPREPTPHSQSALRPKRILKCCWTPWQLMSSGF